MEILSCEKFGKYLEAAITQMNMNEREQGAYVEGFYIQEEEIITYPFTQENLRKLYDRYIEMKPIIINWKTF